MNKKYYSRKFLNKSKGSASIELDGAFDAYSLQASAKITDCNRNATIELYCWNASSCKDTLYKLDTMITELTKFREWYATAQIKMVELAKERDKNKPKFRGTKLTSLDELLNDK